MVVLVSAAAVQLPGGGVGAAGGTVSASPKVSLTAESVATKGGSGNIFVSTAGRDSCTRSTKEISVRRAAGHVCRTPLRACEIARSGDRVIIEDGTYDGDLDACHGHQSYRRNVVFTAIPGHSCRMPYPNVPAPYSDTSCPVNLTAGPQQGLSLGGYAGQSCGVTGNPLPRTLSSGERSSWANHLTFQGIDVGVMGAACAANIELKNDLGRDFYIREGAYHFYILGGDYGNRSDARQPTIGDTLCGCGDWPPAEDVRIEGAVIHDFVTQTSGHGDGLFVQPSYGVQIVKNVLARDDCIPIYVNYATGEGQRVGVHGLRIIGNVIHTDTIHNGGARCFQGISLGNNDQTDTIVAFNSLEGPIRRSNSSELNRNIRIVGNVAGEIDAANSGDEPGCGSGTLAMYNVLTDRYAGICSRASNVKAGRQFVSNDAQPNSPSGTNKYFNAPLGSYLLARRAKGIKRVPTKWCRANPGVCPKTDILGRPRPNPAHPSYYDAGAYENR